MEIVLHLGAHRTGSTTLQHTLAANRARLREAGVLLWGPTQLRGGLLSGVYGDPGKEVADRGRRVARAASRVSMLLDQAEGQGASRVVLSDENFLGGMEEALSLARLYPTARPRLTRLAGVLPQVAHVALSLRAYDSFWASVASFMALRGVPLPAADQLGSLVASNRRWRHVISDVAQAFPGAQITVWSYEGHGDLPEVTGSLLSGVTLPRPAHPLHLNRGLGTHALLQRLAHPADKSALLTADTGDRYRPFTPDQSATLRAAYAQDIAWLHAGADGWATYIDQPGKDPAGAPDTTRGKANERRDPDRSHRALG